MMRREPKKDASFEEQNHREALGRSRGGYSTKVYVIADGHGKAFGFALAPGQAHELRLAPAMLDNLPAIPPMSSGEEKLRVKRLS